ncbi:MAG: glutamate-5-semialdehyde dehydrogenase [Thermodesulfovibrionales bacterium]
MDARLTAERAKAASRKVASASTERKNAALSRMADLLKRNRKRLVAANRGDMAEGRRKGLPENLLRRLVFDEARVESRVASLQKIIGLGDPVGQMDSMERRPNGLMVGRMRVPLGVILMIYEARPHVTVNAGAFALKSGNAIILKGGKEAAACNALLGKLWGEALAWAGLPVEAVQCVTATHEEVAELLQLSGLIDLVIPRGGKGLIRSVVEQSRIPVIKHFEGVCHVYVDDDADTRKAIRIALNSKLLMPEVCNAAETLLVSEKKSRDLPRIVDAFRREGVEVRGCQRTRRLARGVKPASEDDWRTEYLDRIISVRVVEGLEAAVEHINTYGSGHTDAIVTESYSRANRFLREVDSGVVLVNASTMFDDGEELGMGAEIGISTDKLHARGPMGLRELTTSKFVVMGEDHIKES